MSDAIRNETRGSLTVHVCNDCRAWSHEGTPIRHGGRCDTPAAQPEIKADACTTKGDRRELARLRRLAKAGEISHAGLTEDEIVAAVRHGAISESDAMNRDF